MTTIVPSGSGFPASAPCRWATEPFVIGSPTQFARLRQWFPRVHFTEAELCAESKVRTVAHLKALAAGRTVFVEPVDPQSVLVLLFLDGKRLPWEVVRSILSSEEISMLTDLGLLQPAVSDASLCAATVALFPTENLYVVSDRLGSMETIGEGLPADLVYSPLTAETQRFIGLMPRTPCDNYLEMCGGTGIAALIAAKGFARHAISADITDRSTRFARFNAALNGVENFTAVIGDLYEPVAGQTFDLITAHPPYVPAAETEMVFRDGGEDGEQITRRILQGLDEFLRPGGLFYLDAMMTDRAGTPLEQRIRRMLGPAEDEFDVVLVRGGTFDPRVYHADRLQKRRMTAEAFLKESDFFQRVGIEEFVASTVLVQRRTTARPVVTRHRVMSTATRAEHLQWLLRYLTETVTWGVEETRRLLDAMPRALPNTVQSVRSALRDGAWAPMDVRIGTVVPFAVESPAPALLPTLLSRCNGRVTVREHFDRLRAEGLVPAERSEDDFAQLIRELADGPYIELDLFPLPTGVGSAPDGGMGYTGVLPPPE